MSDPTTPVVGASPGGPPAVARPSPEGTAGERGGGRQAPASSPARQEASPATYLLASLALGAVTAGNWAIFDLDQKLLDPTQRVSGYRRTPLDTGLGSSSVRYGLVPVTDVLLRLTERRLTAANRRVGTVTELLVLGTGLAFTVIGLSGDNTPLSNLGMRLFYDGAAELGRQASGRWIGFDYAETIGGGGLFALSFACPEPPAEEQTYVPREGEPETTEDFYSRPEPSGPGPNTAAITCRNAGSIALGGAVTGLVTLIARAVRGQ